jgi:hypothetical protein
MAEQKAAEQKALLRTRLRVKVVEPEVQPAALPEELR